jgi:acyl carrier protein
MTRCEFLSILRSVRKDADEGWLDLPIRETGLDSLDLMVLRSALEAALKKGITDKLWFDVFTLNALLVGLT